MNCIIVDDEIPACEELKYFINKYSNIEIMGIYNSSLSALEYLTKNQVDVVFLDINMPKLNGLELAGLLKDTKVVFVTAYREYGADAFDLNAFDYLVKPYSKERVVATFNRLRDKHKNKITKLSIYYEDKIIVIDVCNIVYIEANQRDVNIYTEEKKYTMNEKISKIQEKLPELFVRCHRRFIVNTDKIVEIDSWFNNTYLLKLAGSNEKIPVSRHYMSAFKNFMHI
ncbi:MAG: LytTR family DNA-binding domain-containing protein [Clostridia bacterium]|jgi:two-component system LytT family response regulator|nr:LytTR family DNA-binding domain-containing protein [Clostridia bacterium]MCI2000543.1 LytTR family DNA-binding domain-containing protein [Clostridia bacterium]MCI2014998.1 LytTR family DNA-binding domain-containing protein [Clostridia bacterium]